MKAITLVSPREISVVDDWPEPECGPGEVIVQMRGVGLCGTDLAAFDGKAAVPAFPWIIGHEGGGDIVRVGADVSDRAVGDRVVIEPNIGCGHCAACAAGRSSLCETRLSVGFGMSGLLAERVAIPADYTWVVDRSTPDVALACFEPLVVAHNAVRRAGVRPGDDALVVGAGSVGQLICHALAQAGAQPWVTEPHPGRMQLALTLGAKAAQDRDGVLYPFVFETSGVKPVWENALTSVAKGGLLSLVGFTREPVELVPMDVVRNQITIRGHLIYDHPADFPATLEAVRAGTLVAEQAVQARYSADDAVAAFAAVREVPGKTWIDFSDWYGTPGG
ncbi:MAG: hypothetical protein QOI54_281 [Actinomycetota bacterium]|jgi:alcohol dehydrogenase/L-iditol 2-dehydrogenase|nr:hypothetical protein [Actinomycetota bacterium]